MALRSYGGIVFCSILLLLPTTLWAAQEAPNFIPLVGIPYVEGERPDTFGDYVNAFYFAAISIAAFLAVVKIIFGGVKYMLTDIVTTKESAKKEIRAALIGLLIVVGAVLILNTINTRLTEIRLFSDAPIPTIPNDSGNINQSPCTTDPTSAACLAERRASCATDQEFVIDAANPGGSCVTPVDLGDEDYTDDPGAGRVACAPLSYNPQTNSCVDTNFEIEELPNGLYDQWVENSGGDNRNIIDEGNSWCLSQGKTYRHDLRACISI